MSKSSSSSSSIGVLGLLGVAFVILKLTDVINWSWWWVTLPFWGGLVLVLLMVAILYVFYKRKIRKMEKRFMENKSDESAFQKPKRKSNYQMRLDQAAANRKKQNHE